MEQENNAQQQPQYNNSQVFKVRGMKTDFSESSFENSFAFENKNMRINIVDEDNTLLNLTNEKGTSDICDIEGVVVGLKKYSKDKILLISTTNEGGIEIPEIKVDSDIEITSDSENDDDIDVDDFYDNIYLLKNTDGLLSCDNIKRINNSKTSLSGRSPLEIEHFNNGDTDYFYAVDGQNNYKSFAVKNNELIANNDKLEYNNSNITGEEYFTINTVSSINGNFFSGVMIYCFAYVNKLGHKTGIIDVSDLVYLKNPKEYYGLEPNKKCDLANTISINNLSKSYEKIEVYSLFRSSLDGEIICRKVFEKSCKFGFVSMVTDYNTGETISYQELISRVNSPLIASTIAQKSSTLFLGNITMNNYSNIKGLINGVSDSVSFVNDTENTFVSENQYFYGLQFQDVYGNWSPVVYVGHNKGYAKQIKLNENFVSLALSCGYISTRVMLLDNRRIRNTICEGVSMPTITLDNGKYGIDVYSPYFYNSFIEGFSVNKFGFDQDIYKGSSILSFSKQYSDLYSPDVEFDENFILGEYDHYLKTTQITDSSSLWTHKIDVEISGNLGSLYNNNGNGEAGIATYTNQDNYYYWKDAISGYQKSLQLFLWKEPHNTNIGADNLLLSLYELRKFNIVEKQSRFKIYTWQPSGSLTDSKSTSILKNKRISRVYQIYHNDIFVDERQTNVSLFDRTTNNIPLFDNNEIVYGGIINHKINNGTWSFDKKFLCNSLSATANKNDMWDHGEFEICDGFSLSTTPINTFSGQPIEIYRSIDKQVVPAWQYSTLAKLFEDKYQGNLFTKKFEGNALHCIEFVNGDDSEPYYDGIVYGYSRKEYIKQLESKVESEKAFFDMGPYTNDFPAKIRVTNQFNRAGSITMSYKTAKHLIVSYRGEPQNRYCRLTKASEDINLDDSEIETGRWIVCSKKSRKTKLELNKDCIVDIDTNDSYVWRDYECLKTEPYSLSDENQVSCLLRIGDVNSYFNPMCRYDNLIGLNNLNGVTSAVFNKLNLVYNQKNNFFVFSGITNNTVTDDNQENTILYSDMKLQNESEDSFENFNVSNFYSIDTNIKVINKLVTYNDKLLCFSDDAIVNVLYKENVVISTDSIKSLGLASSENISGTQLITNTYGCMNKWSVGIYDNILYFNDDINNKIVAYSEGFTPINESLGIETLNDMFIKKNVWNPVDFGNTKINIDKYSKDIHYTGNSIDISYNPSIGAFVSLYSYDNVSYIETIGNISIAVRGSKIYSLRTGEYNYFFGKFEPYWTTVILNQNSLLNKSINNIEFNTEAYSNNLPIHNFTFDKVSFWNDYQRNDIGIDFKMYGISMLKKKFRVWRVNMFRNGNRMAKRNYDFISNPWTYLRLSCEKENTNKLTLHWININYR